jgi:hypothetical protein
MHPISLKALLLVPIPADQSYHNQPSGMPVTRRGSC